MCDVPESATNGDSLRGNRTATPNESNLILSRSDLAEKRSLRINPVTL